MADLVLTFFLMHSPLIDESRIQYFRYNTASVQLTLTESCPKRDVRDTATYLPYLPGQHAGKGRFDAFLLLLQRHRWMELRRLAISIKMSGMALVSSCFSVDAQGSMQKSTILTSVGVVCDACSGGRSPPARRIWFLVPNYIPANRVLGLGASPAQHSTLDGSLWVSRQHRCALKPVISPVRNAPNERPCSMGRCSCRQPQDWATWYSPCKVCKASELSRRRLKLCNRMQMTMASRTFRNYHHFLEFSGHDCTLSYSSSGNNRSRRAARKSQWQGMILENNLRLRCHSLLFVATSS